MVTLPRFVEFREEGPREGFQIEKAIYPLADRVALIDALSDTGLKHINVASLVNPKRVPPMADTPEFFAAIHPRPGVKYTATWLNKQGFLRALDLKNVSLEGVVYYSTSEAFCTQNNNRTIEQYRKDQHDWIELYKQHGVKPSAAYIATAFGCNMEGEIPEARIAENVRLIKSVAAEHDYAFPALYLADTVGWANPEAIKRRIGIVRDIWPGIRIGLHLHDTRGLGPANFYAALEMGVDLFDSSLAALGGCPFAGHKGAAGNICTEDMVFMCNELGIETGIDLDKLIDCAVMVEAMIGRSLNGKIMHSGSLSKFRKQAAE
ncbi:MAG: hydroxymethylglutaryl-CoA lyase [Novosphingobium sp.]|nr:hydroxymethylglutaryl-CoA lyase [Novosphingobium sp.]